MAVNAKLEKGHPVEWMPLSNEGNIKREADWNKRFR